MVSNDNFFANSQKQIKNYNRDKCVPDLSLETVRTEILKLYWGSGRVWSCWISHLNFFKVWEQFKNIGLRVGFGHKKTEGVYRATGLKLYFLNLLSWGFYINLLIQQLVCISARLHPLHGCCTYEVHMYRDEKKKNAPLVVGMARVVASPPDQAKKKSHNFSEIYLSTPLWCTKWQPAGDLTSTSHL